MPYPDRHPQVNSSPHISVLRDQKTRVISEREGSAFNKSVTAYPSPRTQLRWTLLCVKTWTRSSLTLVMLIAIAMTSLITVDGADAQELNLLDKPRGLYLGVRPGEQTYAPGKKLKPTGGVVKITWVGFQARGSRGRVFIQSDSPPIYEFSQSRPKKVIIDFPNARLHTRNDARSLDTAYFPTVVRSVKAKQIFKSIVRVSITLREPARYTVKKDKQFLHLLFDPPKKPINVLAEIERESENAAKRQGGTVIYRSRQRRQIE
jgi:hypothetical protein